MLATATSREVGELGPQTTEASCGSGVVSDYFSGMGWLEEFRAENAAFWVVLCNISLIDFAEQAARGLWHCDRHGRNPATDT